MLLLVNLVFSPFAKEDALSLRRYNQHVSGTLFLKSCSKSFPSFFTILIHLNSYKGEE